MNSLCFPKLDLVLPSLQKIKPTHDLYPPPLAWGEDTGQPGSIGLVGSSPATSTNSLCDPEQSKTLFSKPYLLNMQKGDKVRRW